MGCRYHYRRKDQGVLYILRRSETHERLKSTFGILASSYLMRGKISDTLHPNPCETAYRLKYRVL